MVTLESQVRGCLLSTAPMPTLFTERITTMSQQTLEQLMQRYLDDAAFRTDMQQDPIAAAQSAGFNLDDGDREVLSSTDWGLPDQELKQRVTKALRRT